MKPRLRAFLFAHFIASYLACPALVALEVYVYRPIHYSQIENFKGALAIVVVSPLSGPLLLVGTPMGLAIRGMVPPLSWVGVAVAYVLLELAIYRLVRWRQNRNAAR